VREFNVWKNALRAVVVDQSPRQRVDFLFTLPFFFIIVIIGIQYPPPRVVLFLLWRFLLWRSLFFEASR
jgi:hypothetical protein